MSEKYSGTLSQETDFSKNKKQISVGIWYAPRQEDNKK